MNDKQRRALMKYWWPQACRAQGWSANDRDLRLRALSLAVSFTFADQQEFRDALENYDRIRALPPGDVRFRHLESAGELNDTSDIDAVKNLLLLLNDNVAAADEHDKPERSAGRRQRNVLEDKIRCLSQYPLAQPMGLAGARAFVQKILNDKFNRGQKLITITLEEVDDRPRLVKNERTGELEKKPSQKTQLLMTINARLNGKSGFRAAAGHSVHDMLTGVGLPCGCKRCLQAATVGRASPQAAAPSIVPPLPVQPDPSPALAADPDPELEPAACSDPDLGPDFGGESPF